MPRLSATPTASVAPRRAAPKMRARKTSPPPDRLSQRALLWRRVRRSFWPGVWVVGLVGVLGLGHALFVAVADAGPVPSPVGWMRGAFVRASAAAGLRIAHVEVVGAQPSDMPELTQVIGVQPGDPSFGFSIKALQARVQNWGPVQTAVVQRELPGTLVITITERAPLAILQVQGTGPAPIFTVIDGSGQVVQGQDGAAAWRRQPSLLLVSGSDAPAKVPSLIAELKAEPDVLARVTSAQRVDGLRWNLILKDEAVVKLPVDGEQAAIAQLSALQASMALLDRPVEVIDLRIPGKLIVRPYPTPDTNSPKAGGTKT